MKIQTLLQLTEALDSNSGPRKKELINMQGGLGQERAQVAYLSRVAAVFAYAHWEGFIKYSSWAYLVFASRKSRPLSSYSTAFQALTCRSILVPASKSPKRIGPHLEVVNRLTVTAGDTFPLPVDNVIDTESNLSWDVFENICNTIGLGAELSEWQDERIIINQLVKDRCQIAHGEILRESDEVRSGAAQKIANDYINFSLRAINRFSTNIQNAASQESYLIKGR